MSHKITRVGSSLTHCFISLNRSISTSLYLLCWGGVNTVLYCLFHSLINTPCMTSYYIYVHQSNWISRANVSRTLVLKCLRRQLKKVRFFQQHVSIDEECFSILFGNKISGLQQHQSQCYQCPTDQKYRFLGQKLCMVTDIHSHRHSKSEYRWHHFTFGSSSLPLSFSPSHSLSHYLAQYKQTQDTSSEASGLHSVICFKIRRVCSKVPWPNVINF